MSIHIYDGADFTGKTTSCANMAKEIINNDPGMAVVIVHFPIRDMEKDIILCGLNQDEIQFTLCDSLRGKTIIEIQDTIKANLERNSLEVLRLVSLGHSIIIDRFIYSNIVYRKLYCEQNIDSKDIPAVYPLSYQVIKQATCHILIEDMKELLRRKSLRYQTETPNDESIDAYNEQDNNIYLANKAFSEFSRTQHDK